MAWGLEARVPFLDKAFLEVAMNIDPQSKMFAKGKDQKVDKDGRPYMEKVTGYSVAINGPLTSSHPTVYSPESFRYLCCWQGTAILLIIHLCCSLSDKQYRQPYLPSSILWRQKEQFSDGVGYSWIDG
jgi:asparagine synthase (glutamine-hydrolysing)